MMQLFNTRLGSFFLGFISSYFLNNIAIIVISIIVGAQISWLLNHNEQTSKYWDTLKSIVFNSNTLYPAGYITGLILSKLKFWLIIVSLLLGYFIAVYNTPDKIDLYLHKFVAKHGPFFNITNITNMTNAMKKVDITYLTRFISKDTMNNILNIMENNFEQFREYMSDWSY